MNLADHADHTWSQQGRCVYCNDCDVRLYQGKLPALGKQKEHARATDDLLAAARRKFEAKHKKEWDERTPEQEAAWRVGKFEFESGLGPLDVQRKNPFRNTPLGPWFIRGWRNADGEHHQQAQA